MSQFWDVGFSYTSRSNRTGSINKAPTSSNVPPTTIPISLKGSRISHTSGYNTSASKASGQHRTRSKQNNKNLSIETTPESLPGKASYRRNNYARRSRKVPLALIRKDLRTFKVLAKYVPKVFEKYVPNIVTNKNKFVIALDIELQPVGKDVNI
jgi:hypothetical protein